MQKINLGRVVGKDATINGYNAISIQGKGAAKVTQQDDVLTIDVPESSEGSGGASSSLERSTHYNVGDFAICTTTPKWVTLCCTQSGDTASVEPAEYASIAEIGDTVTDGTCIFTARNIINELDDLKDQYDTAASDIKDLKDEVFAEPGTGSTTSDPVGTIRYFASEDVEEGWLKCDGSFIQETSYPDLVAALGKKYPSGDKFKLISSGEISPTISNGVLYEGYLWVFSLSDKKLYGVPIDGEGTLKQIPVSSTDSHWSRFITPSLDFPLCLSIVPHTSGVGAMLFITQISNTGYIQGYTNKTLEDYEYLDAVLIFGAEFNPDDLSLEVSPPFTNVSPGASYESSSRTYYYYATASSLFVPYVTSINRDGEEVFLCACGTHRNTIGTNYNSGASLVWKNSNQTADVERNELHDDNTYSSYGSYIKYARGGYSKKNHGEAVNVDLFYRTSSGSNSGSVNSTPMGEFSLDLSSVSINNVTTRKSLGPLCMVSSDKILASFDLTIGVVISRTNSFGKIVKSLFPTTPPSAKLFVDAGLYAWGKDMFFLFIGTGILFSRDLESTSWGYLDTTSILGTITQFGYLDYDENSGTLYLVGQDTDNVVKVAKLVLNTLYDYASDGAWLPLISSDGVPAYIRAIGEPPPPEPPAPVTFSSITVNNETATGLPSLSSIFRVTLNGETLTSATNKEYPVSSVIKMEALQDYTNPQSTELDFQVFSGFWHAVYQKVTKDTQLIGKVLARGESIKKGDSVEVPINMQDLKNSNNTYFIMVTTSAQGS